MKLIKIIVSITFVLNSFIIAAGFKNVAFKKNVVILPYKITFGDSIARVEKRLLKNNIDFELTNDSEKKIINSSGNIMSCYFCNNLLKHMSVEINSEHTQVVWKKLWETFKNSIFQSINAVNVKDDLYENIIYNIDKYEDEKSMVIYLVTIDNGVQTGKLYYFPKEEINCISINEELSRLNKILYKNASIGEHK